MPKRVVLYLRVSTQDQTTRNQELELRSIAERMGCEIAHVYKPSRDDLDLYSRARQSHGTRIHPSR